MSGWVKLWRKSLDSGLPQNLELWGFWCWCILKASHQHHKQMVGNQIVELQPGQFVFGRKKASQELNVSEKKIRTYLKKLENLQNVAIKRTNKFSIVSIVNWDIYQQPEDSKGLTEQRASKMASKIDNDKPASFVNPKNKDTDKTDFFLDQQNGQQMGQPETTSAMDLSRGMGQQNGQQMGQQGASRWATDKKTKNVKKKEKEYTVSFEKFWTAYPNKKCGKKTAFKAWSKQNGNRPDVESLLLILEQHKKCEQWQRDGGQYIPMATTWINQERWDAEMNVENRTADGEPF